MGYTHYWNITKVPTEQEKIKVITEINILLANLPKHSTSAGGYYEEHPIVLRGGLGEGKPIFTKDKIWFNGDSKKGLDHETFVVDFNDLGNLPDFNFCKTARKPYDFVVCVCLLSLANNVEGFTISSDGDAEEWEPAIDFYKQFNKSESDYLKKQLELFNYYKTI